MTSLPLSSLEDDTQRPVPPSLFLTHLSLASIPLSYHDADFKNYIDLPLARIKRIMKSDEDVHMISAEVLVLFAKACEMFILEGTIR